MNNFVEINGEKAVIAFDPGIQMLRGEFVGLKGGADFYAGSLHDLIGEGRKSLAVYLEMCRENGVEPRLRFSGRFNVRLTPADHAAAVIAAAASGNSLDGSSGRSGRPQNSGLVRSTGFERRHDHDRLHRAATRRPLSACVDGAADRA